MPLLYQRVKGASCWESGIGSVCATRLCAPGCVVTCNCFIASLSWLSGSLFVVCCLWCDEKSRLWIGWGNVNTVCSGNILQLGSIENGIFEEELIDGSFLDLKRGGDCIQEVYCLSRDCRDYES